ncbi:MAG TPA: hypothetical protein VGH52_03265 [Gaiellaceae bacterium]|jgi:hypothetical protein
MRPTWAQIAAGILIFSAGAAVVILPGKLFGPERVSAPLGLPATQSIAVQAHAVRVPVTHRVITRHSVTRAPVYVPTTTHVVARVTTKRVAVSHAPRHVVEPKVLAGQQTSTRPRTSPAPATATTTTIPPPVTPPATTTTTTASSTPPTRVTAAQPPSPTTKPPTPLTDTQPSNTKPPDNGKNKDKGHGNSDKSTPPRHEKGHHK